MSERISKVWTSWQLLRHFGPRWAAYRAKYALERRSGWRARRATVSEWNELPLSSLVADPKYADADYLANALLESEQRFFFTPEFVAGSRERFRAFDDEDHSPIHAAEEIAAGQFSLFRNQSHQLGMPPNWHRNYLSGEATPTDMHWSRIDDFAHGDIKVIWDLNRFHFAFDLARAYARDGDERWLALFWMLVEDWREDNPPNLGANWKCGQEASLRAMAWCFALFAMAKGEHTTATRVANLVQMLAFTAQRVASNIDYAVSQKNNHGISEAVGLLTIGLLLPELQHSDRWRQTGRQVLSQLARDLIYDDGGFSQHSWNYHRLMLHDFIWAIRLAEIHGDPLPADVIDRVGRAGELLYQVMDVDTGSVPCYGQDDGSLILPLNNCGYFDYRPVVQATAAVTNGQRVIDNGAWDEDCLWLLGDGYRELQVATPQQKSFTAPDSGYAVLRSDQGFAFTRAATFRHRPAQDDLLHLDIWWRGQNIAIDPGTFSYNAAPPWNNPLAEAKHHNTVTVDGHDPMTRVGRFVWLPWLNSQSTGPRQAELSEIDSWHGQHDGYQRLRSPVEHVRSVVRLPNEHWLVLDRLESTQIHNYRLHWLLEDLLCEWSADEGLLVLHTGHGSYRLQMASNVGEITHTWTRGDAASPRGWRAHGYQNRQPAISVDANVETKSCHLATVLGPDNVAITWQSCHLQIDGSAWSVEFPLARERLT